jgi:hypothetical protein
MDGLAAQKCSIFCSELTIGSMQARGRNISNFVGTDANITRVQDAVYKKYLKIQNAKEV